MAHRIDPSCRYSKSHEWIRVTDEFGYIGISDYAQQQLSDIVYVEVPEVGDSFTQSEVFGVIESVKAATDCYLPVAGEIVEVNQDLEDTPELVNKDPYGDGWLVRIAIEDLGELDTLMSPQAYETFVKRVQAEAEH
ncbi:MAG: glycine cleavage system protein GcvH [Chloroflexi bacterium]|nr:glycine cleavage system protein GcvH [Chloroflexota bacterium]